MDSKIVKLSMLDNDLISGTGYLQQFSISETYQLHCHTFYELFFINKGKAIHNVNNESQLLTEGSFVFIRPNDSHKYSFFNEYDFEIINISFLEELFLQSCAQLNCSPDFFHSPDLPPHIIVEGYNFTDIKRKLLHIEKKETGSKRNQYLRSILPFFLCLFLSHDELNPISTKIPSWLSILIDEMSKGENYTQGLPLLLKLSNMSQEHLTRKFRKHLNLTPTEFINSKRMNLAVSLLLESSYEIIDICHECGFNNLSYFYRIFQKQFNCSPKRFLERYNGK